MLIEIYDQPFEPYQRLQQYQSEANFAGKYGATAVFVGTMREFNQGDDVEAMLLEHYPGMTEKYLNKISEEAAQKWDILDSLIVHRIGEMRPNDPIVLVAVWSAHRAAAFDASRYLMEELKSRAPFWKKETLPENDRWVEKNT
ncbi:MAG: molybdenum cofactor biosynthesis protein MoaE [Woeseiaceae bacterium]